MLCPNCAAICEEDDLQCPVCNAELLPPEEIPVIVVIEESAPVISKPEEKPVAGESAPAVKKGRLWPPLVAMLVMVCLGTLLFFLIPSTVSNPTDPITTDELWFTVENGALTFHAEYYDGPAELEIPSQWNGETVTALADYAFSGVDSISTVILPQTINRIGDYAFSSCENLRGIYIPSSVTAVGVYAFADCDSLEAIYLPGELETLGHGSLDSCNNLHYILFDGTYAQWTSLYNGYFVSDVELHTVDGTYYAKP